MPEPKQKPKKIGRPTLPKGHAKSATVLVRLSPDDRKRLESAARVAGQTVSEWLRSTIHAALQG